MYLTPDLKFQQRLKNWSRGLMIPVFIVGGMVLAGWEFDVAFLKAPVNKLVAMNPVVAWMFLLSGIAFLLLTGPAKRKQQMLIGYIITSFILLVAIIKLLAVLNIVEFQIDTIFYSDDLQPSVPGSGPNKMANYTACCFLLTAISLLILKLEKKRGILIMQGIALFLGFTALLCFLVFIYQKNILDAVPTFVPMAAHSALCFMLLSIAFLFATCDRGLMKDFTSVFTGSVTAASLIPAAIIVPTTLGLLRLYGGRAGLYSHEFGLAFYAIAIIVVFFILIWYNTILLNKRDIIKKTTEDALAKSREENAYLASLVNNTSDAVVSTDINFVINTWNKAAENMFGYTAAEAIGKTTLQLIKTVISNEEREQIRKGLEKNGFAKTEIIHLDKNGNPLDLLVSTTAAKNENGEVYGYISICHDISVRKKLEEELQKTNKELEAFTYSVSHDLRAPLRAIMGFTSMLEEDYTDKFDDEGRRITTVIKDNALNMGNLIDDLLNFSRTGRHEINRTEIDMEKMVQAIIVDDNLKDSKPKVQWIIHPLPEIKADINMIRQVWINLLYNAVKYSGKKEDPVIEVGAKKTEHTVIFYVKDNGVGFDQKYADKLFKVFQRLHSVQEFEGTGVGLALAEKIITKHGGSMWAEGEINKGATFYFSLAV